MELSQTPGPSNLFRLPLEVRLQILRYILPSQTYFIFRHPQCLAWTASPLQKPIFAASDSGQYAWTALDRWKAARKRWLILTHPRTPCTTSWAPLLYASRDFKEDCYTVLYGDNRFIFHVGSQAAYAVEQSVRSTPFKNPLLPDDLEPGLVFPASVMPYVRKVYFIIRACINDVITKPPPPRVTRWQQKVNFDHIDKLRTWIAELARLLASARDLTNLELIVRHYRRMTEDQALRYYNNVPAGLPVAGRHNWQAMHDLDEVKQSFALVRNESFPNPEVFNPLQDLRDIANVRVSGLNSEYAEKFVTTVSSIASKDLQRSGGEAAIASSAEDTSGDIYSAGQKRGTDEEDSVPQRSTRKKARRC